MRGGGCKASAKLRRIATHQKRDVFRGGGGFGPHGGLTWRHWCRRYFNQRHLCRL